jgi:hypothetical protein
MKLTKVHLFIILVLSLILASSLGGFIKEGMTPSPTLPAALQPIDTRNPSTVPSSSSRQDATKNEGMTVSSAGIPQSAIPQGKEDLYILKSQIVPPTSPAGSVGAAGATAGSALGGAVGGAVGTVLGGAAGLLDPRAGYGQARTPEEYDVSKCPPCPACARCPEPSFECKKVPNYSRSQEMGLPLPVMADFSNFGM